MRSYGASDVRAHGERQADLQTILRHSLQNLVCEVDLVGLPHAAIPDERCRHLTTLVMQYQHDHPLFGEALKASDERCIAVMYEPASASSTTGIISAYDVTLGETSQTAGLLYQTTVIGCPSTTQLLFARIGKYPVVSIVQMKLCWCSVQLPNTCRSLPNPFDNMHQQQAFSSASAAVREQGEARCL